MSIDRMFRMSLFLVLISSAFAGCALQKRVDKNLPSTFLEDVDIRSRRENLPFDHAWVRPGAVKSDYDSIYFAPVRVDLLPLDEWTRSSSVLVSSKDDYYEAARDISRYFREQLIEKTREHGSKTRRLMVTDSLKAASLVMKIAITELELAHPVARAASLAAPVPGTGAALGTVSDPYVTFAARLVDSRTGELVATAADRKFSPTRIVNLNKLTVSSSAREICALWADTVAEALQSDGLTTISEKRFEILPW